MYYILKSIKNNNSLLKGNDGKPLQFDDFDKAKRAKSDDASEHGKRFAGKPSKMAHYAVVTANQAPDLF
jgi:hypothetical protein